MASIIAMFAGFFIGGLVASSAMRWAYALHQTIGEYWLARQYPHLRRTPHVAPIFAAVFLCSAPWMIAGVTFGTVKLFASRPEWGYWFFGGMCFYLVLVGFTAFRALRAHKAARNGL